MEIYLPIAEMSVHWLVILGMGAAVGFLSGLFGIGGGFLLTPLLIFAGIPPGVAVATTASQVSASTFSGVITHWRQKTVDIKMGAVMLAGGLTGTTLGVYIFGLLRAARTVRIRRLRQLCRPSGCGRQPDAGREHPHHPRHPFRHALPAGASPDSTTGCTACRSSCASAARGSISASSRR